MFLNFSDLVFAYPGQKQIFRNLDFGIDMNSRGKGSFSIDFLKYFMFMNSVVF